MCVAPGSASRALGRGNALGYRSNDLFLHSVDPQSLQYLPEVSRTPPIRAGRGLSCRVPDLSATLAGTLGEARLPSALFERRSSVLRPGSRLARARDTQKYEAEWCAAPQYQGKKKSNGRESR